MNSARAANSPRWLRIGVTGLLAGYWLAMFIATHLPQIPAALQTGVSDKWEHFAAYALLGLLLAAWTALRLPLRWRVLGGLLLVIAGYAMADELLQIPVGRQADVRDWLADVLGAAVALGVAAVIDRLTRGSAVEARG